ncbi:MAG: tyrosine-type recombinase/integrase [Nostoc sp. S13]|nr:tyrosine-type recombinase/integrase [Nostoc sp. S13]MDF5736074.1 tyrosine-type recombinase/integrase [Nostoc sp. S13]
MAAGISKHMTPHKIRHSGITDSLEVSNEDYRKVQSLSRHADPRTVMIYDDNRKQYQAELSSKLAQRVGKRKSS